MTSYNNYDTLINFSRVVNVGLHSHSIHLEATVGMHELRSIISHGDNSKVTLDKQKYS